MAEPPHLQLLARLVVAQQQVHRGAPAGRDQDLSPEELELLLRHAARFRCDNVRSPFALAPDDPDAHEAIYKHITVLMEKLIAAKWFLKDLEAVALEWLAGQFTGRAADKWTRVVAAARVTATTSGIAENSVLYRCLRDMVLAYPAVGIKSQLQMRKARDLPWQRKDTVAQTASRTIAYYEALQRAGELTRHLGITLQVPFQDWPTRLTEMQTYFPGWASQLVVDHPERFTSEQDCWAALVEEAARKAAGKAMGAAGGLAQLGIPCTVGELDCDAYQLPAGLFAPGGAFYEEEYLHDGGGGSLFAMRGRVQVPGCWRCGSKEHLRKDCSFPASAAELAGAPINQWAKLSPSPSSSTLRAAGATVAHGPAAAVDKRWSRVPLSASAGRAWSCRRRRPLLPRSLTTSRRRILRVSWPRSTPSLWHKGLPRAGWRRWLCLHLLRRRRRRSSWAASSALRGTCSSAPTTMGALSGARSTRWRHL